MNKSQVTYIVNTLLDDATDTITPLRKCAYFVMTKEEVKFNKYMKAHFYFDTTNGVVNKYDGLNEQGLPIWTPVNERMYGKWLSETAAKQRLTAYLADPTHVSDNRYLHIKF